jgi:hypothetical protein
MAQGLKSFAPYLAGAASKVLFLSYLDSEKPKKHGFGMLQKL